MRNFIELVVLAVTLIFYSISNYLFDLSICIFPLCFPAPFFQVLSAPMSSASASHFSKIKSKCLSFDAHESGIILSNLCKFKFLSISDDGRLKEFSVKFSSALMAI